MATFPTIGTGPNTHEWAYRSGRKIEWDAEHLKVKNAPDAPQLIHKEYRKGWTL